MSITSLVSGAFKGRQADIEAYAHNSEEIQRRVLAHLVKQGQRTQYGKTWGMNGMQTYEHFANGLPVTTYEELKEPIDRMRHGEADVLWPGVVKWYAKSSGTTNDKSKFIPVSAEGLKNIHYKGGKDAVALYLRNNPKSKLFDGRSLILGGSHASNYNVAHSLVGDLSAILIENINPLANLVRVLELSGKSTLAEVWPGLEVFFHGGIAFGPYREQYRKLVGSPQMRYMETYNASEGFFGLQDDPSDEAMLLMIDYGVFYEFIPMDEFGTDNASVVPLWDVQPGKNYAMVISTTCGLWRYVIGDTVTFTSTQPYKFKITGRTKYFINAFGEELIMDNAEQGLAYACKETGAEVLEYTAAPVFMDAEAKCRHQWLIEFAHKPADLNAFAKALDLRLQQLNSDYEAKRHKDITLQQLEVVEARQGLFNDWLKSKGKLGGQHKVPRLSNSRKNIEELLKMC